MEVLDENDNQYNGSDSRGRQNYSKRFHIKKVWKYWKMTTMFISSWRTGGGDQIVKEYSDIIRGKYSNNIKRGLLHLCIEGEKK